MNFPTYTQFVQAHRPSRICCKTVVQFLRHLVRMCYPSMEPMTLGKFHISWNLTVYNNLSRSGTDKCFDNSLLRRTSRIWSFVLLCNDPSGMRKKENGTTVLSKKWLKTQAFPFIKYNILNLTMYRLVYCFTDCIMYWFIKRNKTTS